MAEQVEEYRSWLDPLIQKISPKLGEDFTDVQYKISVPTDSHFLSRLILVEIIANNSKEEKKVNLVVKRPSLVEAVRKMLNSDQQFHNEILFYKKYATDRTDFSRCIYADEKPPVDSVIVLENVITRYGYHLQRVKQDIPMEYAIAACKELARFHANAYAMKEQRKEEFFDIINNIREDRFHEHGDVTIVIQGTAGRAVEYLRDQSYDQRFCDKMDVLFENVYKTVIEEQLQPEEPLATLCHGDFTMNNMMFKRENGEIKTLLIDFATIRYSSPAIDISTLLCLHCAKDFDQAMLNNILKVYHDSLTQCLKEAGVDCEKYSYEAFYEDYKKKGLFGFFIASFFLVVVMNKLLINPEDLLNISVEDVVTMLCQAGGDEVSKILANMLLTLKEFGCLDHLL
ncbi:uncharacterized protein LOC108627727 [Ceratina calcarata]|uniref:Uncharacterized protein LOC108627727 n=1 Tax=Ceratina calcarata TaxID=156304 RepID=A0AAJ7J503_9HYME|nr:uncharacterized protein LOC108627727 [Ceratina calcarata]